MGLPSLSPEAQLLLLSAAGSRTDSAMCALLASRLDWGKLSWLAEYERAAPVLFQRLASLGVSPPPGEGEVLRRLAMVSEFKMLHLEQRLAETLAALADAGIEVMLLKGAALALTVYGSFVRRPMLDLDLLVAPARVDEAQQILLASGWSSGPESSLEEFFEGHHHLPALEDARGTGVRLELHTALFFEGHPFRLPLEDLWRRAVPVIVRGVRAYVPDQQDELLHLCLHFGWSHMMSLGAWRAFRDLDALLAAGSIDWDRFVALAVESRGATCCYWTLRLARALTQLEVPAPVLGSLRPPEPEWLLRRVEQHFATTLLPTESVCPSVTVAYSMWRLAVRPSWSGHGAVRPWDRADDLLTPVELRPSGVRRLSDHLRNLRGWARYARLLASS